MLGKLKSHAVIEFCEVITWQVLGALIETNPLKHIHHIEHAINEQGMNISSSKTSTDAAAKTNI